MKLSSNSFPARIEQEFINSSAIAPNLFQLATRIVSDTETTAGGDVAYPIHEALNWRVVRFGAQAREHLEALLFRNEDGSIWQSKLSRSLKRGEKPYFAPTGNGSRAYLPPVPTAIRQLISGKQNTRISASGSFWDFIERHPEITIVLTEGGKKSLSLLSHGEIAISLYGCSSGVSKYDRIAGEKIPKLKPELIPDLQRFAVPGRKFVLAFDQDAKSTTRYKVSAALGALGRLLVQSGCEVEIARWDGRDGKGVDDLIANRGVASWTRARSQAVSFAQWSIETQLAREVRRKPDLSIGDREFVEIVTDLAKEGIVALHGGKGSGKSVAIGELIEGRKWLSITHRTSVGRDQGGGWKGAFVNDSDRHGSKLLKDGVPVDGGSVCVPSLLKVQAIEADVLILDETTAILEFLLGSRLANKNGIRPLLLREFIDRVQSAKLVLIADADLTEEALQYIESIRGERAYLVRSERKALTYAANIIEGSKTSAIALLQQHIEQLPEGKIIYINCDSKGLADSLAELLGREQTLSITGDTSGGEIETSFLASKGRDLPGLILQGVRFIVSSPSVTQGFSIEHHTNLIDSVWGFYSGCSISAHQIAQAPDRVRSRHVPRYFWIANRGSAYSPHSHAFTVAAYLKEFRQLNTVAARLVAQSLTPEVAKAVESIDWQSENLKMFAALEVRRNLGMVALRETLIALLKKEGKIVSIVDPKLSETEIQAAEIAIEAASQAIHKRYCEAVEAAADLEPEKAKELESRTEALSPDEVLALTKYYVREFYALERVTSGDVEFDRKGRTRTQIKRLEAVLHPDIAVKRTARSIEQNPETPQDWKPDAVETWLLEQSGAAKLIRQIAAGAVNRLPADTVGDIALFVRLHPTEFRLAFKFKNVEALTDQQIVGEILTRHGIRTQRRGNRNNLRYEVCQPELQEVLAIVARRRNRITPPEEIEIDPTGAIPLEQTLTQEDLDDIRDLYLSAESPELQATIAQLYPIDVIEQAINRTA